MVREGRDPRRAEPMPERGDREPREEREEREGGVGKARASEAPGDEEGTHEGPGGEVQGLGILFLAAAIGLALLRTIVGLLAVAAMSRMPAGEDAHESKGRPGFRGLLGTSISKVVR
jgi:hypothetical protein